MKTPPGGLHVAGCLWVFLLCGCGPKVPPQRYIQSASYHAVAHSTVGVLQRDVVGIPSEVAAVRRSGSTAYKVSHLQSAGETWRLVCEGDTVRGEELLHLTWLGDLHEPSLLMVIGEETPDETIQEVQVLAYKTCTNILSERVRIPRGEATPDWPAGVVPGQNGQVLFIYDQPDFLHLTGADGPQWLPVRMRERCTSLAKAGEMHWQERSIGVLLREPITALAWHAGDGSAFSERAELKDGDENTAFVVRQEDHGKLVIESAAPMDLLEIHHGCAANAGEPLTLTQGESAAYETNNVPKEGSFIRAAGRRRDSGPYSQDLLALASPTTHLEITLSSPKMIACLREIKAFGLRPPQPLTRAACQ